MNYQKIPTIQMNKYYTNVINKEKIISFIKNESNVLKIEEYVKHNALVLKNYPQLKIQDVIDIMEYSNSKINELRGLNKVSDVFNKVKKETNNLSDIEIIYTPAQINDKNKEGYRHDCTYLKINDELYEVINVQKVMSFIGNKEILKNLSRSEIISSLKEYSKLIRTNVIDNNGEITTEQIEEEINQESDLKIRDALLNHKNDVVEERKKLEEYINKNMPGEIVHYGVNSNGERIYIVKDKLIKFEGKNREMQILSDTNYNDIKYGNFENKAGYQKETTEKNYNKIDDFVEEQILLIEIIDKSYNEMPLTNEEINMLIKFLQKYIDALEKDIEIDSGLIYAAEKWYENSSIGNEISKQPQELQEIYDKVKSYRKNKVKIYELNVNNSAFISILAMLEFSLVVGLIISLVILFK